MNRERLFYVYAHANSLAELALKAAVADADAWMLSRGLSPAEAESQSAEERAAAESRALESAFDGLDMNALDGLPFFGAESVEESAEHEEPANSARVGSDGRPESEPERESEPEIGTRAESRFRTDTSVESEREREPKGWVKETAGASSSESPRDRKLQQYLDKLYQDFDAIQQQAASLLGNADVAELEEILARQDPALPAFDKRLDGAELQLWLQRYQASDSNVDELVVWVRTLEAESE